MKDPMKISLLATDLDGTILPPGGMVAERDIGALLSFSEAGVITVLVTGRSLFSYMRSLPGGLPFDYIIFSTGAGIWDNRRHELLRCLNLQPAETAKLAGKLLSLGLDFMLQHAVPDNHHFSYHTHGSPGPDFLRRLAIYEGFHEQVDTSDTSFEASQAIIILPEYDQGLFASLEKELGDFKVVRTTSPIDQSSVWVEVFPKGVSKGHGLEALCESLDVSLAEVAAIGNDFNDLDMLAIAGYAYVVDSAPPEMKARFTELKGREPLEALLHMRSVH